MKKLIMLALALSVFVGAQVAHADDSFKVTDLTCNDFLSDEEGMPYTLFWMAGYLGAKSNQPVLGSAIMEQFSGMVIGMCQESPEATLGDVLNHLGQ